jgi:hypothetical protein
MKKMKKILSIFAFATALATVMSSCEDKEKDKQPTGVVDGYYITGDATALNAVDKKGLMVVGFNEANSNVVETGLYEKYIALEANKNFNIVLKEGATETSFGGTLVDDPVSGNDQLTATVKKCILTANANLSVDVSGVYHLVVYKATDNTYFYLIPVQFQTNGIGQKTPDPAESGGYKLQPSAFNKETMTFSLNKVLADVGANFKIKNYDGWKYELKDMSGANLNSTVDNSKVIKVNTNFGDPTDGFKFDGSSNEVVRGSADIKVTMSARAYYTVSVVYTLAEGMGITVKFTNKSTEGLDPITPVQETWSLIGSAFNNASGTPASWDYDVDLVYDAASSTATVYNYKTTNLTMLANGEFKIRKDHDWTTSLGWGIKIEGDSGNFSDPGNGNIKVVAEKTYSTIVYSFDWDAYEGKITFTE